MLVVEAAGLASHLYHSELRRVINIDGGFREDAGGIHNAPFLPFAVSPEANLF